MDDPTNYYLRPVDSVQHYLNYILVYILYIIPHEETTVTKSPFKRKNPGTGEPSVFLTGGLKTNRNFSSIKTSVED